MRCVSDFITRVLRLYSIWRGVLLAGGDNQSAIDASFELLNALRDMGVDAPVVLISSGFLNISASLMTRAPNAPLLHRLLCECLVSLPCPVARLDSCTLLPLCSQRCLRFDL